MTKTEAVANAGWNFDHSYARLPQSFFSKMQPTPVQSPKLVCFNEPLAEWLGLNSDALRSADGAAVFAGNSIPEGAMPLAQAYAGHQFGGFTMLGDGRALLLGEQLTPRDDRYDVQLKGSGPTPYSRRGDGRAALGPMLREYIISEAMHALGIPTTRSLAVTTTGERVYRETVLQGAVLTRIAASHLRVGTFEYVSQWGTIEELKALADYALQRHYPEAAASAGAGEGAGADGEVEGNRYLLLLREVIRRQAELIAQWQLVGFIHGVMNTDNMAISGETIDYGPCAFMDTYDPATVFSSIDRDGRYAYGQQPYIGGWNLARLAETLLPLLHDEEAQAVDIAQEALSEYAVLYHERWMDGMRAKLGLLEAEEGDESLVKELLSMMNQYQADYTNTFLALTMNQTADCVLYGTPEFTEWHTKWQKRIVNQTESAETANQLMRDHNPAVIPRNHRVEEALAAAVDDNDYSVMERLLDVLSQPYAHLPEQEQYAALPGESAKPYRTFCGT